MSIFDIPISNFHYWEYLEKLWEKRAIMISYIAQKKKGKPNYGR